ncbi:HD domain-containing protein [Kribbella sp. CA-253562]|uniref:HD domain-containing protein n=1 Tax=Kribbella sp. CA-253562 TaxID=3239942 RepID=UPI003D8FF17E
MSRTTWAKGIAEDLLAEALPQRWSHVQGVAGRARTLDSMLGEDAELIEIAAWLHDVGYSPSLVRTGFHPLDGARYLRDEVGVDEVVCQLVAHHTAAAVEAEERGLTSELEEFARPAPRLLNALIYCDLTAGVDGSTVDVDQRLAEILTRYPPEHVVHRSITRSAPILRDAARTVSRSLAGGSGEVRGV